MRAKIVINGTLHNLEFSSWRELWRWLAKTARTLDSVGTPVKTIGIVINGH